MPPLLLLSTALAAPPDAPTLVSPADGATGVALSPELTVSVSDPDGDPLTVEFRGRRHAAPGEDFTVVVLPDTQFYACACSGGSTETFLAQTAWVAEQIDALGVAYVAQLGDCVENGDSDEDEWLVADEAFSAFEEGRSPYPLPDGGLPYGIAVGNHDQTPMGDPDGTTTFYNEYFGIDRFADRAWYGGHYGTNYDNHYDLFEAGGVAFVVVYFEYDTGADPDVLAWADEVLSSYADRHAIVVSHYLLNADGSFSTQGQAVFDALSGHANLFLMLAGHVSTEARREDEGARTVYSLLSDYQSRSGGGDGWLRLLSFSPAGGGLSVSTWSPTLEAWEDDEESAFSLPWDPNPAPWDEVGAGSPTDSVVTLPWSGLAPATTYEWTVTVSDGMDSVSAGPWVFTTGAASTDTADSGAETDTPDEEDSDSPPTGEDSAHETGGPIAKPSPSACGCSSHGGGAGGALGLVLPLLLAAQGALVRRSQAAPAPLPAVSS